jgi:general secretion pathway protein K
MALLTVLLLVAVMGTLTAAGLETMSRSINMAGNSRLSMQARYFTLGAETYAILRISDMLRAGGERVTLAGNWNGREFKVETGAGPLKAKLTDGGNCFNLNSVAEGGRATELTARPRGVEQFVALMTALGVADAEARRAAVSLADWVDADTVPLPGGAEDETYLRAPTPYRAGNTMVAEPSELRAIAGFTPEIYDLVRPWVCALPSTAMSPININTLLPSQAPLLAMLLPGRLDIDSARKVLFDRPVGGWDNLLSFWKHPILAALSPRTEELDQPKLATRFFNLEVTIDQAGYRANESALLDFGESGGRVVQRRWTLSE